MGYSIVRILVAGLILGTIFGSAIPAVSAMACVDCFENEDIYPTAGWSSSSWFSGDYRIYQYVTYSDGRTCGGYLSSERQQSVDLGCW